VTDEQLRYVEVPGARLWTVRRGRGPAMVFLHGGPGMWDYLGPVAALVEDVVTAYRYDQRGGGRSPGGPPYDVATAIADLDAVREAWGVDRWVVFGYSWGATLALAYAVTHPERTNGLVYVSGTGIDPAWHAEYRVNRLARLDPGERARYLALLELPLDAAIERERTELMAVADLGDRSRVPALLDWLYGSGFKVNHEVNAALGADAARFAEDGTLAARLPDLRVPTLVIHGAVDPRPARHAARLAELITGAELLIMPEVGHYPRFEAPAPFNAALRAFLGRLG
jgi:proline iminopeptidase